MKDGRLIDVSLSISPIRDTNGKIIGVSQIARDISERKRDEIRKNDFIGMVSHELKTPLTSLTAIMQVLHKKLNNTDDRFVPDALARANQQLKRMGNLINGFLNVSRLESGKIVIEKRLFIMEDLIKEVIAEINLTGATHMIELPRCDKVEVFADRDKINSVVTNLLSNAIKYSPKASQITITCEQTQEELLVSVNDEGLGMKADDCERIFDRYHRVESDDTRHISGFGIGLYLSAEIVKRHDGRIWAESELSKGSTFYFSLPLG
ncbi:sensor histidine kinase [Mucilaginibacter antarcticus]|uniref:histidine kinase n=1 Tax=Mucilaginibacter antarcticus TaxID=1855725 RepID=A0ABW5XPR6_9SPHI